MNIEAEQRAYRREKPSFLGRGIGRLTHPFGKTLAGLVPTSMIRKIIEQLDTVAGAPNLADFDHDRVDLAACRREAGKVETVARSLNASSGAAAGLGGVLTMSLDIPTTIGIALRNIRDTARVYGFYADAPAEQIFRLQILELATLDDMEVRSQRIAALEAGIAPDGNLTDLNPQAVSAVTDQVVERVSRALALASFRQRAGMIVPLVGAAVGGLVNSSFQRDVSRAARFAYQARRLQQAEA